MKTGLMLKLIMFVMMAGLTASGVRAQVPLAIEPPDLSFFAADEEDINDADTNTEGLETVTDDRIFYTSWGASLDEVDELEAGEQLRVLNEGSYTTASYTTNVAGYEATVFYMFLDNKLYSTNYKFERLEADAAEQVSKELEGYIVAQMNQPRYLRGQGSLLFSDGHALAEYFWYVDGQVRELPSNIKPFFNRITFQDAQHADVRPALERFDRYWKDKKSLMDYYEKGDMLLAPLAETTPPAGF